MRWAIATALLVLSACRPGEGERCFCEGECRRGFVCAADGAVLGAGQCVNSVSDSIESGTCIEASNIEGDTDDLVPKPQFDLGSAWATDPAVTTLPGTDGPMTATTSAEGTTIEMSSSDTGSSTSTGATTTDTDTGGTSSSSSGSTGSTESSGPMSTGTAG